MAARLSRKALGKRLQHQLLPVLENANPSRLHAHQRHLSEKEIQDSIVDYLSRCSSIAWVRRMNSGLFRVKDHYGVRWIRAGFEGCPDIMAQTTKGQFVAIEVKNFEGCATPEQIDFLQAVRAGGGIGIIARSVDDVISALR